MLNDELARTRRFESHDRRDLILGSLGDIAGPIGGILVVKRKVNVVAAGADQIKRIRVRDATVVREIGFDLGGSRHSRGKKVVVWTIGLLVTGAAGRKVGAATAGIIGRNGGGPEKGRQQLARHQARAGCCTPSTLLNRVREQVIKVVATAREWHAANKVVAVPARVDGAFTKANELIDGLCSSRA